MICDKSQQKLPYVYFDNFEIFSASEFVKIELRLLKISKKIVYFLLFSLYLSTQLFRSISQNKPGRHKVPFVVMCHICDVIKQNQSEVGNIDFEI